ncbi:MAG: NUDIX hydrolase [Proteobacteria bacterium]|nr:NUDIX hydrolase [Pseudomonadota bacterium]
MLTFLDKHSDCFERSCIEGHFTGSSWLLSKDHKKALILHHKKLNQWLQLGGHCDGDTNVLNVAIKEAQEESGILGIKALSEDIFDIDIHKIPARKNEPEHLHLDVRFLLHVVSDEEFIKNEESNALKWIDLNEKDYPESLERMIKKWANLA